MPHGAAASSAALYARSPNSPVSDAEFEMEDDGGFSNSPEHVMPPDLLVPGLPPMHSWLALLEQAVELLAVGHHNRGEPTCRPSSAGHSGSRCTSTPSGKQTDSRSAGNEMPHHSDAGGAGRSADDHNRNVDVSDGGLLSLSD